MEWLSGVGAVIVLAMFLVLWIDGKRSNKNARNNDSVSEEEIQQLQQAVANWQQTRPSQDIDLDDAEYEFGYKYERKLDRFQDKIDKILLTDMTADERVEAYKKVLAAFDEIKAFCESKGSGGVAYYQNNLALEKEKYDIEFEDYLKEEYHQLKEEERLEQEEEEAYNKHYDEIEAGILKLITESENGLLQKDLYKEFSPEDKNLILNIVSVLVQDKKLTKEKKGNSYLLQLMHRTEANLD